METYETKVSVDRFGKPYFAHFVYYPEGGMQVKINRERKK